MFICPKYEHRTNQRMDQIEEVLWWNRNYTRNLFQMFCIKIRKNLNFRFLLN